jgi:DnaJ-class molecular chaperone
MKERIDKIFEQLKNNKIDVNKAHNLILEIFIGKHTCPSCDGKGRIYGFCDSWECNTCNGTGNIYK